MVLFQSAAKKFAELSGKGDKKKDDKKESKKEKKAEKPKAEEKAASEAPPAPKKDPFADLPEP